MQRNRLSMKDKSKKAREKRRSGSMNRRLKIVGNKQREENRRVELVK